jgi:tRNA dimethylallyltransferase
LRNFELAFGAFLFFKTYAMLPLITLLGPTASGKTKLAVALAQQLEADIISADSRQIFREMDIGSGKDLSEYQNVPYHLIDIRAAGQSYHVYQYQLDFQDVFQRLRTANRNVVLCGGTGLYIEAVLKGHRFTGVPVDETQRNLLEQKNNQELFELFRKYPSAYSEIADISSRKKLIRAVEITQFLYHHPDFLPQFEAIPSIVLGIDLPAQLRRSRISMRLRARIAEGMVGEVEQLLAGGVPAERLIFYGLEYKLITEYLLGQLEWAAMLEQLETGIHQYAKRQMTFFRKMEKNGIEIHWLDGQHPFDELVAEGLEIIFQKNNL